MKVLDIFSGIGSFQSGAGACGNADGGVLRMRCVLPAGAGEALAGGAVL